MISSKKNVLVTALAAVVAVVGPHAFAQDTATGGTRDAKPREAAAPTRNVEITLPVRGLTKENAEAAVAALKAHTVREWVCPKCSDSRLSDGECKACKAKREVKDNPAFADVTANPDRQALHIKLAPGAFARLSSIENLLRAKSLEVQRDKLALPGPASVIYSGASSAEDATRLDKAFREAGHDDVAARYELETKEVFVTFSKTTPNWAKLTEVGSKLTERPLKLADVHWTTRQPKS